MVFVPLVLLLLPSGLVLQGQIQEKAKVPPEYQQMYSTLKASLDSYDAFLVSCSTGVNYPVVFGAELLTANSNRGTDLLSSQAMQGVLLNLDRLRELGIQGVTFPVGYPLYTPTFPRYQEYVQFYKQVVQEVRRRDMKIDVESSVLFGNTVFSTLTVNYAGLTFEQFKVQRKQMIATIIQDLHPDYLNLGAEPDTQYLLTGFKEFNSPEQYTAYINYVLDGLERGSTMIGAGMGTWGNMAYVQKYATGTTLDFIAMHVYPIVEQASLKRIFAIADVAKQYGKRIVLDEAWLSKADTLQATDIAADAEIFRRDAFSFWAPLDQQFLGAIVKSAQLANIEYISPFWTTYFFSYVDYDPSNAQLPYKDLVAVVNKASAQNMIAGKFSSTAEFYKGLIGVQSSATSTTLTPLTKVSESKIQGFLGLLTIAGAAITIGLATFTVLRRRQHQKTR